MNLADLNKVARAMVAPGKGLLAADESTGTIKKRFDAINVASTEENRRDYREMLFRSSEAMRSCISGVILYDETIWQNAKDGTSNPAPSPASRSTRERRRCRSARANWSPPGSTSSSSGSRNITSAARALRNGAR